MGYKKVVATGIFKDIIAQNNRVEVILREKVLITSGVENLLLKCTQITSNTGLIAGH